MTTKQIKSQKSLINQTNRSLYNLIIALYNNKLQNLKTNKRQTMKISKILAISI